MLKDDFELVLRIFEEEKYKNGLVNTVFKNIKELKFENFEVVAKANDIFSLDNNKILSTDEINPQEKYINICQLLQNNTEDIIELFRTRLSLAKTYCSKWENKLSEFCLHIDMKDKYKPRCNIMLHIALYITYKLLLEATAQELSQSVIKRFFPKFLNTFFIEVGNND